VAKRVNSSSRSENTIPKNLPSRISLVDVQSLVISQELILSPLQAKIDPIFSRFLQDIIAVKVYDSSLLSMGEPIVIRWFVDICDSNEEDEGVRVTISLPTQLVSMQVEGVDHGVQKKISHSSI
jgi:hypothetical protein